MSEIANVASLSAIEAVDRAASLEMLSRSTVQSYAWNQNYRVVQNLEFICPDCKQVVLSNWIFVIDLNGRRLISLLTTDGQYAPTLGHAHPHVDGGMVCMGQYEGIDDIVAALCLGFNHNSCYFPIRPWLFSNFGHDCWGDELCRVCWQSVFDCECCSVCNQRGCYIHECRNCNRLYFASPTDTEAIVRACLNCNVCKDCCGCPETCECGARDCTAYRRLTRHMQRRNDEPLPTRVLTNHELKKVEFIPMEETANA